MSENKIFVKFALLLHASTDLFIFCLLLVLVFAI